MLEPVAGGPKPSVLNQSVTDNLRQCGPLLFVFGRDHAPAVFAFTWIAIMRRGAWSRIANGLRIFAARRRFHQIRPDHECRCFRLRQVDERALLLAVAIEHPGYDDDRAQDSRHVVRENRLRTDRRVGDARMIPEVRESGERGDVYTYG